MMRMPSGTVHEVTHIAHTQLSARVGVIILLRSQMAFVDMPLYGVPTGPLLSIHFHGGSAYKTVTPVASICFFI